MANASDPTLEDCARAYQGRLTEDALPAAVIDAAAAEVIAANPGGMAVLGLPVGGPLPAPLDSAMPAIAILRDVARLKPAEPVQRSLILWQGGHVHLRSSEISIASESRPSHVYVVFRPESETAAPAGAQPVEAGTDSGASHSYLSLAANDDAPPPQARDDSETLKEIARQIQEGHRRRAALADSDPVRKPRKGTPQDTAAKSPGNAATGDGPVQADDMGTDALSPARMAELAHELKTPLAAIAAAAEIMRDQRLGPMSNDRYLGYAGDIYTSATHALAVITAMLAATPGETSEPTELASLAATTVSALQPLADARGVELVYAGEPALAPLNTNPTAIRQILINLLTNALKFTPKGGAIRVTAGHLDNGAQFLAVRDTGDGMDEEALTYALADHETPDDRRPGGGRGIGLRLVRKLAAETGATFEIDSVPGEGTSVLMSYPKR